MPWFWALVGGLSVVGWFLMIVESSWMLLVFVYTLRFWLESSLVYFLIFFLVIHLSIFCFGISALGLFYLGSLLGCCFWVVTGSGGSKSHLFLSYLIYFQKNTIFFSFGYVCISCIFHWHGTCIRFACWFIVIFSSRNDCTYIEGKILHLM